MHATGYSSSVTSLMYDEKKYPTSPSTASGSSSSSNPLLGSYSGAHNVHFQGYEQGWDCVIESSSQPIDVSLALAHNTRHTQRSTKRICVFASSDASSVRAKICRPPPTRTPSRPQTLRFDLEVHAPAGPVTLYLPSDFRGHIRCTHPASRSRSNSASSTSSVPPGPHHPARAAATAGGSAHGGPCPRVSFSAGFANRVLPHARVSTSPEPFASEADVDGLSEQAPLSPQPHLDDPEAPARDSVRIVARRVTLRMWDVHTGAPECVAREAVKRLFGCGAQTPEMIDWDFLVNE